MKERPKLEIEGFHQYLVTDTGQTATSAHGTIKYLSRLFHCLEITGASEDADCGVLAGLFHTKTLKQLQATELLSPKLPWTRHMASALSHFITFRAEQAAQQRMHVTASATARRCKAAPELVELGAPGGEPSNQPKKGVVPFPRTHWSGPRGENSMYPADRYVCYCGLLPLPPPRPRAPLRPVM